jgi:septum site-determining protein MinC
MTNNDVVIKSNKYGLSIVLTPTANYEDIKVNLAEKISAASKFFSSGKVAIAFEGKELSNDQQIELMEIITNNSQMQIVCLLEKDEKVEAPFKNSLEKRLEELSYNTGQFYKGTLRSGQQLEIENSVIVIGDVNPGAKIISKGNIIILGALKGSAYAGAGGNSQSFVIALNMQPGQIKISDIIARAPDVKSPRKLLSDPKKVKIEPKIAFVEGNNIYIEPLDKSVLNDIKL